MNFSISLIRVTFFVTIITTTSAFQAQAADPFRDKYPDIVRELEQLAQSSSAASLIEIGTSDSGVKIKALKVGSGPVPALVVAAHHGNEYGSVELGRAFARSIVQNPLPDHTVFVVPVLNAPGYDRRSRRESARGRSFDPNRDYPGPCGSEGPFNLKSTRALADLVVRENIVVSATLHTFYPAVVYPWGFGANDLSTRYDSLFFQLGKYATEQSHYPVGNSTDLIYPAKGTFEDWAFWKHGVWSLLFEVGRSHRPSAQNIAQTNRENVPGLRKFISQAPTTRADKHDFESQCDRRKDHLDLHNE